MYEKKTIEQLERQIERISRFVSKPSLLLKAFQSLPDPIRHNSAPIEIKVLTVIRAPLIRSLAEANYKPSSESIYDYASKTSLTSEIAECIKALGMLGYTEAIPFIEESLEKSRNWYRRYSNHPRARGINEALNVINYSEDALRSLRHLIIS